MAYTSTAGRRAGSSFAHRFDALRAALRHRRARRAAFNQTYRELSALSDRDLADLGFARADIPFLAREAADRV